MERTVLVRKRKPGYFGGINRSPEACFGYVIGDKQVCDEVVSMLPRTSKYCEVMAGSGLVLLNKPCYGTEVVSDRYRFLGSFLDYVSESCNMLVHFLNYVMYSERRFWEEKWIPDYAGLPIERAKKYVLAIEGTVSNLPDYDKKIRSVWNREVVRLKKIAKRFENVIFEEKNIFEFIKAYDSVDTTFYVDPLYALPRNGGYDGNRMRKQDQIELAELLNSCEGFVLIFAQEDEFLDNLYRDWTKYVWYDYEKLAKRKKPIPVLYANYTHEHEPKIEKFILVRHCNYQRRAS